MDADGLRRLAGQTGFDVATLEKDCALSWLIQGIYDPASPLAKALILKGGTAIRKVYSHEWRLSEDLDFTIIKEVSPEIVRDDFGQVFVRLAEQSDISFEFSQYHGRPYVVLARVQFQGPLDHKNKIKLDISLDERLVEDPTSVDVASEYDDIPDTTILVYTVNEILVEKMRSMMQRGYARDYYDVWRLMREWTFDTHQIRGLLIQKCELTAVNYEPDLLFDADRLSEAERHWEDALGRLTRDLPVFNTVIRNLRNSLGFLRAVT